MNRDNRRHLFNPANFCLGLFFLCAFTSVSLQAQFFKKTFGGKNIGKQDKSDLPLNSQELRTQIKSDYSVLENTLYNERGTDSVNFLTTTNRLIATMKTIGLLGFKNDFRQTFSYTYGKYVGMDSRFILDRNHISIPQEAFPLSYSDSGLINGYFLPDSREFGQPWVIPLLDNREDGLRLGRDLGKETYKKAYEAQKMGASAVVFYDPYGINNLETELRQGNFPKLKIPVLFVSHNAYKSKIQDFKVITPFYLKISFRPQYRTGVNLIGGIDNHAAKDVIIFSHLHLDRVKGKDVLGDGIGSVVSMLNLARLLVKGDARKSNYIFVILGETDGMNATNAFLKRPIIEWNKVSYVLDLDRIANLDNQAEISVEGVPSSTAWLDLLRNETNPRSLSFQKDLDSTHLYFGFNKLLIPGLGFSDQSDEALEVDHHKTGRLNSISTENLLTVMYHVVRNSEAKLPLAFAGQSQQKEILWRMSRANREEMTPSRTSVRSTTNPRALPNTQSSTAVAQPPASSPAFNTQKVVVARQPKENNEVPARSTSEGTTSAGSSVIEVGDLHSTVPIENRQSTLRPTTGSGFEIPSSASAVNTPTPVMVVQQDEEPANPSTGNKTIRGNSTGNAGGSPMDSESIHQTIGLAVDTSFHGYGVLVEEVMRYSSADRAGIRKGDLIMVIGRNKINDLKDYIRVINGLKIGDDIVFRVKRGTEVLDLSLINF